MTVTLTGGSGLFDRLGVLGGVLNSVNGYSSTLDSAINTVQGTPYSGATNTVRRAAASLIDAKPDSSFLSFARTIQSAAQTTLIQMVNDDDPLAELNVLSALNILIAQMESASATVNASEPGISIADVGTVTGTGKVFYTLTDEKGRTSENALAEDIDMEVTSVTTAGAETWTISGEDAASSKLDYRWPLGSDASTSKASFDASSSSSLAANGDFEDWTSNVPDSWTLDTGTAGTHLARESSAIYKGTYGSKWTGDGSTLTKISQSVTLSAQTVYGISFTARKGGSPAAGVLQVDLYDPATASVLQDDEGNDCSFTVSVPSLTTSFAWQTGTFRFAHPAPSTIKLRLHLTTAITNTANLYLDHLTLRAMTRLYTGGPYVEIASGATNWVKGDKKKLTVTQSYGAWQKLFDRFFDMTRYGLLLPSATGGGETINDSLITV